MVDVVTYQVLLCRAWSLPCRGSGRRRGGRALRRWRAGGDTGHTWNIASGKLCHAPSSLNPSATGPGHNHRTWYRIVCNVIQINQFSSIFQPINQFQLSIALLDSNIHSIQFSLVQSSSIFQPINEFQLSIALLDSNIHSVQFSSV